MKLTHIINNLVSWTGYHIEQNVSRYVDAKKISKLAQLEGISVCEYLERLNTDKRKIGRRDRIIRRLNRIGIFNNAQVICEIGAGTGMYLEEVIKYAPVKRYEVYETAEDWNEYLKKNYSKHIHNLIIHKADGISLKDTKSKSVDLVHAHAVFVYIPVINTFKYLLECIRVCKKGGYIVFDTISNLGFGVNEASNWIKTGHEFAVITPEEIINDLVKKNKLIIVKTFTEIYAGSSSKYFILKKL